jgi:hypothetical protein
MKPAAVVCRPRPTAPCTSTISFSSGQKRSARNIRFVFFQGTRDCLRGAGSPSEAIFSMSIPSRSGGGFVLRCGGMSGFGGVADVCKHTPHGLHKCALRHIEDGKVNAYRLLNGDAVRVAF